MKFSFRKIASVLASVVMVGSTVGTALAANYPAPFVSGGSADSAIVVTSGTHLGASTDLFAAIDLQQNLQSKVTSSSGTSGSDVSGEASALFTSSSKIYYGKALNNVKNVITKTELPTVLKDGSFSGNVDSTYTQTVYLGSNPTFTFAKQPTSSDDPDFGLSLSTSTTNYVYNATVTFNKDVNFASSDSKNQEITLFGQKYTVGASTDGSNLVLLKEATKLNFDSSGVVSQDVTVAGKEYTVELVSASTSAATIKVTNKETGSSDQKEVSEGYSKKINGVTVAVNTADSNNLKYTASVIAGAEKVTFSNGNAVTYGDEDTTIDGTKVTFTNASAVGAGTTALSKIVLSVAAKNSDSDALKPGQSFVDPVFGTFKVNLAGINVPQDGAARETIKVGPSGDDKMVIDFTDYNGQAKTGIQYLYNRSTGKQLEWDTDGHQIAIAESALLNRSDYVVVGNENEGHLVKVTQITNQTTGYSNDRVTFQDIFSGDTYTATITGEGAGSVTIGGKVYSIIYQGASDTSDDSRTVRVNYPDSASTADMVIYPTISTSKGAKVMFYKPLNITVTDWDGAGTDIANVKVPNGANSYQSVAVSISAGGVGNYTIDGTHVNGSSAQKRVAVTGTGLVYNFTFGGYNATQVFLVDTSTGANIANPAIVILEEKDDNSRYNALIVSTEAAAATSTDGIGVGTVVKTYDNSSTTITLASDSKKEKLADYFGAVALLDKGDSDQAIATISYPDEQIYAQLYLAEDSASITPGETSGVGGTVLVVKDTEVNSVKDKNLVVVGGSCINTVAAKLLGSDMPVCGAEFTTKTGVDAGKYIIKAIASPYNSAKTAVLVAGYEAEQTKLATAKLKESHVTDVGTSNVYPLSSA